MNIVVDYYLLLLLLLLRRCTWLQRKDGALNLMLASNADVNATDNGNDLLCILLCI